jgi:hypothetical protein
MVQSIGQIHYITHYPDISVFVVWLLIGRNRLPQDFYMHRKMRVDTELQRHTITSPVRFKCALFSANCNCEGIFLHMYWQSFWRQPTELKLTPQSQLSWLYLITNTFFTNCQIYCEKLLRLVINTNTHMHTKRLWKWMGLKIDTKFFIII